MPTLSRCGAYGAVVFGCSDLVAIASQAKALRVLARPGPEQRGLDRLHALAVYGARESDAVLRAVGDQRRRPDPMDRMVATQWWFPDRADFIVLVDA
ncbi:hypothetical protein ABIB25_004911 [Nakamurella sp. UYEF19]|uniref:hypothetical protein n=1 Tax=Nakamurella sp. UYEF19 TaxID=1756392 RepID=UPI00339201B1